jgi:predicted RNase H-like HicB family nuclease
VKYRVLIEQDEDGVFVAEVPSLPGCISQGKTRAEALENVREAIAVYLESLEAHGEPVSDRRPSRTAASSCRIIKRMRRGLSGLSLNRLG